MNSVHTLDKYFRALTETVEDFVAIVDPKEFKALDVNKVSEGYKKEEVLGFSVLKFLSPEYHQPFHRLLLDVSTTGKKGSVIVEVERRTNETGKAWYKCYVSPVFSENGNIESLIIMSKDITESKLSSIQIRNKEERLYAIINNTTDMILSIDRNYRLIEYNSVYANVVEYGYKKKDLIGTSVLDYINPAMHKDLIKIYERVFAGETVNEIQKFPASEGEFIYFETGYNPIRDYNQDIVGISIFSKNTTKRVLGEQQLMKALKEKEVLLSEIHHRIKNNLAIVSSMLQLKEMFIENEEALAALKDSRRRIKSTALVHEMLYRNEAFDKISVQDYLRELFNNITSEVELDLKGDKVFLSLRKAQPFGLMVHELMMNSIKHSFKDGNKACLSIITESENGILIMNYSDGRGEFPENVNFYDTSSTGLMLIHTFIEQLEGKIELVSKIPPSYKIQIPFE